MRSSFFALTLILLSAQAARANNELVQPYPLKPDLAKVVRAMLPNHLSLVDQSKQTTRMAKASKGLKGWDHFYALAVNEGIDPRYMKKVLRDSRMPKKTPVVFNIKPRESSYNYRKRLKQNEVSNALSFYKKHTEYFKEAEHVYEVPRSIILSILQIETRCGNYTGKSRIFPRLARLASAAEPRNIQKSLSSNKRRHKDATIEDVRTRAKWLEDLFLPHTLATLIVSEHYQAHPLDIKGSRAGAFGLPQFLPGSYVLYAIDGDGDGRVDLFEPGDAIISIARFLNAHGWNRKELSGT